MRPEDRERVIEEVKVIWKHQRDAGYVYAAAGGVATLLVVGILMWLL